MWTRIVARSRPAALGLTVAVAVAGLGYVAVRADIPDTGIINGCYNTTTGLLRVIDSSGHVTCHDSETALSWNQTGPQGPRGLQGPAGPAGPPGPALASLDQLNGISCDGQNGKPATVRVTYGSGVEAPVSLACVTHLVANPGAFSFKVASGTLSTPMATGLPLLNGGSISGQIDFEGRVSIPATGVQLSNAPFDVIADMGGSSSVHSTGTISLASTGIEGSLDPGTGGARLTGGFYASVTLTSTALVLGQPTTIYSGTCTFGSAGSPISITLTTTPPGIPYSQTTGVVTLSGAFNAPSLDGCNPAVPSVYAFLLNLFAGSDQLTLAGGTTPILIAT